METISTNTEIEKIIRDNKIFRFASELQYSDNEKRKELLREILTRLKNNNSDDEKAIKAREEITKIRDKLNENQLKKKWHRLLEEQKVDQIKKYFDEKIEDIAARKIEMNKVLELLKNGDLANKYVIYDEKNGKIENIEYEKEIKKKQNKT
jgi:hypothetical protein